MANMMANIEQLLAELVQITTRIAALINATGTNASGDSDSLTSNANRLSLSATIIAVAAFFIASLQAILEYSSSGESARRKCNLAAIGPFSKYVVKKWSFRHWRWKFYYPVLRRDLLTSKLLQAIPGTGQLSPSVTGTRFRTKKWHRPILYSGPRATWVQLMSSIDAMAEDFVRDDILLDVDGIPGSLDVPPQIVSLVELGKIAVFLGCDSITINAQKRHFQAVGRFGSITTEELAGFGKVVRFQKYDNTPNPPSIILDPDLRNTLYHIWIRQAAPLIQGVFNLDAYKIRSDGNGMSSTSLRNEASLMISALNEAAHTEGSSMPFDDIYKSINVVSHTEVQTAFALWQASLPPVLGTKAPNILIALAIAAFPCGVTGFPGRSLLLPFLVQCRQISRVVYERCGNVILGVYRTRDVQFEPLRSEPRAMLSKDMNLTSLWTIEASNDLRSLFRIDRYLNSMEWQSSKTEFRKGRFRQWRVILAPITDLLENFDPRSWAQSLREKYQYSDELRIQNVSNPLGILEISAAEDPLDLLIIQIILLDIWTLNLLRTTWKVYAPQMIFAAEETYSSSLSHQVVFLSCVHATILGSLVNKIDVGSGLFESFDENLLNEVGNSEPVSHENRAYISQIADFLTLRVVLYAAYLMIIPDTSDIFDTMLSVGPYGFALPMI